MKEVNQGPCKMAQKHLAGLSDWRLRDKSQYDDYNSRYWNPNPECQIRILKTKSFTPGPEIQVQIFQSKF